MADRSVTSVRRVAPVFVDARGTISDILENEPIESVAIITSHGGAVRGNHTHQETVQWIYMLHGRMRMTTQWPGQPARSVIISQGDLLANQPGERHAMRALEDCTFLVLTRGPRGGRSYEADTFRLPPSELLERPDAT